MALGYVMDWLWAILSGAGKMFVNPIFYYLFFLAGILGVARVKRERRNFHVRIQDAYFELRQLFRLGILVGIGTSVIALLIGLVIPFGAIVLFALFTFLWSVTTRIRIVSPAYIVGAAFYTLIFASGHALPIPLLSNIFVDLNEKIYPAISVLLAILLVVEGILIRINGAKETSPKLLKSKRGQWIGIHEVKRLWAVPLFLLIPGDSLSLPFDWWPLFSIGGHSYSLLLVPFAVGFHQQIQARLPKEAVKHFGKQVISFGIIMIILSAIGFFIPLASIVVVAISMIGREAITFRQRLSEANKPVYFSKRNNGVMIIGVLPNSPAEKMGLGVGEIITKVNGSSVHNESTFYEALIYNRAHCKLEVLDVNSQVRFVQRALYEGEHHELGVLIVSDLEKWQNKAV